MQIRLSLSLCNADDESVLVRVFGDSAEAWANDRESLCGVPWECDADGQPYALVDNTTYLPQAIAAECDLTEDQMDTAGWYPPTPPTIRNC